MKINDWLLLSVKELESAGIGTARLDSLVLLADATKKNKAYLLAHPETELSPEIQEKLDKQVQERSNHKPLAQIREKTEFYGREFIVNKDVLEPRPESETMIVQLLSLVRSMKQEARNLTIIDVGTGSGALAVTAKLELPEAEVIAIDIDKNCLKVAQKNATNHDCEITFYQGDLLEPLYNLKSRTRDLVLANLPYVPNEYQINQAAMNEPRIAIFGGEDGLDLYKTMFKQLAKIANKSQFVLTESLPFQHKELKQIAKQAGYKQMQEDDFIQLFMKLT